MRLNFHQTKKAISGQKEGQRFFWHIEKGRKTGDNCLGKEKPQGRGEETSKSGTNEKRRERTIKGVPPTRGVKKECRQGRKGNYSTQRKANQRRYRRGRGFQGGNVCVGGRGRQKVGKQARQGKKGRKNHDPNKAGLDGAGGREGRKLETGKKH